MTRRRACARAAAAPVVIVPLTQAPRDGLAVTLSCYRLSRHSIVIKQCVDKIRVALPYMVTKIEAAFTSPPLVERKLLLIPGPHDKTRVINIFLTGRYSFIVVCLNEAQRTRY